MRHARSLRGSGPAGVVLASLLWQAGPALANVTLIPLSADPYTNTSSYHRTEVEPDTFSFGSTIVAAFQVGRFQNGGASNIGWATSMDAGASWTRGFLPGITRLATPAGPYDRASDPSVAYDAQHGTWMISSLALAGTSAVAGVAILVSRSTDGGTTWTGPVIVAAVAGSQDFDKNWIACDNTPSSRFYGHCYTQWDDFGNRNQLHMSTSFDGGLTWAEAAVPRAGVIGGQPLVQPTGTVVVPIDSVPGAAIEAFVSTDGGASYAGPHPISNITSHAEAGDLRSGPLPSADIDAAGKVYVVWSDCRFISGCTANDIVMSASTDGTTWTSPVRIPIDPTTSGVDHFLPGLAVDHGTSGASAHLAVMYYYYPSTGCSTSTCQLDVGFASSTDGGVSWTAPTQLAGPIPLTALPLTDQGYMVGDYFSVSFAGGTAHPVFATVDLDGCTLGQVSSCDEFMVTPATAIAPPCLLDVDGNGRVEVSTDIVYVARYLLGLTPVPPSFRVLDPTIPPDATIAANIESARPRLDVDMNGQVAVSTDIVYIARHLLGLVPVPPSFRALDPTIPPDAMIAANVDALCP